MTTKDGIFSLVIKVPWSSPMAPAASMPTMTPAHQGQLYGGEIKPMVMVAPTAPTNPTDRSMSPIRRA